MENAKLDITNKTVKDTAVSPEVAIPVIHKEHSDTKITKVTIITNQAKFSALQAALYFIYKYLIIQFLHFP